MVTCCAFRCGNRTNNVKASQESGLSFFKFPKNPDRRDVWIKALQLQNWQPNQYTALCSKHFEERYIDRSSLFSVRLEKGAVPTIFSGFPSKLQKKKSRKAPKNKISPGLRIKMSKVDIVTLPVHAATEPQQVDVNCSQPPAPEASETMAPPLGVPVKKLKSSENQTFMFDFVDLCCPKDPQQVDVKVENCTNFSQQQFQEVSMEDVGATPICSVDPSIYSSRKVILKENVFNMIKSYTMKIKILQQKNRRYIKKIESLKNKPGRKSSNEIDNLDKSHSEEVTLEEMDLKPKEVILLKLSNGSCILCGSTAKLRNLHTKIIEDYKTENYLEMFLSCFNIKLIDSGGNGALCETCVSRLRDAASFRAQVEAAGALLQQVTEEPTVPYPPKQHTTIEDSSSTSQIRNDVDTTFNLADWDTSRASGTREILEITWSEDEEAGRREGRVEWIDQIPKYPEVKSVEPKLSDGSNQCTVCGEVFKHRLKLQRHFESHLPKIICEICGRQFNFMQVYKAHLGIHLAEHRVSCAQCGASLASKAGLMAHCKSKHQGKKLYCCPQCGDRFGNTHQRNEHLWEKHGVEYERYQCPECSRVCRSALKLNLHMRAVHRQEKNVECLECDKVFFSKSLLKAHLKRHSKEKNFMCDLCGKAFKLRRSILKHLSTHYDIRNIPCPLCDAVFTQTTTLKCHVRNHHKDVALMKQKTSKNAVTNEPEIVYTITFYEDESTKVEDVIM